MNKTQLSDRECIALDMYNAFFSFLHDEDDVATLKLQKEWIEIN